MYKSKAIESSREFKDNPVRVILEISPSGYPAIQRYKFPLNEGDKVVFIEAALEGAKENSTLRIFRENLAKQNIDSELRVMDARNLDFADESIDIIVLRNVLNSPPLEESDEEKKHPQAMLLERITNPEGYEARWAPIALSNRKQIIKQCLRVLKPAGELNIYDEQEGMIGYPSAYWQVIEECKSNPSITFEEIPLTNTLSDSESGKIKFFRITKKPDGNK